MRNTNHLLTVQTRQLTSTVRAKKPTKPRGRGRQRKQYSTVALRDAPDEASSDEDEDEEDDDDDDEEEVLQLTYAEEGAAHGGKASSAKMTLPNKVAQPPLAERRGKCKQPKQRKSQKQQQVQRLQPPPSAPRGAYPVRDEEADLMQRVNDLLHDAPPLALCGPGVPAPSLQCCSDQPATDDGAPTQVPQLLSEAAQVGDLQSDRSELPLANEAEAALMQRVASLLQDESNAPMKVGPE